MTKSLPNPILNIFNLLLPKRLNIIRSYLIIRIISRLSLFFTFTANDTYFRNWIFVFWKIVVIFSSFFFYNVVGKRLLGDGFSSSVFGFATGWSVVVVDSRDDLVEEEVVVGEDGSEFVFFSGLWGKGVFWLWTKYKIKIFDFNSAKSESFYNSTNSFWLEAIKLYLQIREIQITSINYLQSKQFLTDLSWLLISRTWFLRKRKYWGFSMIESK